MSNDTPLHNATVTFNEDQVTIYLTYSNHYGLNISVENGHQIHKHNVFYVRIESIN